jgi:hypothetical protein
MERLQNNLNAADYIGIPANTLQYWRTTGAQQIPFIKVGRRVMYRISDLDAWLAQHTYKHTGEYNKVGANHE